MELDTNLIEEVPEKATEEATEVVATESLRGNRIMAYGRFLGAAMQVNFKSVMEYRINFILQFFGMMLNNAAFALFWAVLIGRAGMVGGYGFTDVMFIWALVSTSFGLAHILAGNVRMLGRIVMEGGLDVYLLQPKDVMLNLLVSRTIVSAWGDFVRSEERRVG